MHKAYHRKNSGLNYCPLKRPGTGRDENHGIRRRSPFLALIRLDKPRSAGPSLEVPECGGSSTGSPRCLGCRCSHPQIVAVWWFSVCRLAHWGPNCKSSVISTGNFDWLFALRQKMRQFLDNLNTSPLAFVYQRSRLLIWKISRIVLVYPEGFDY